MKDLLVRTKSLAIVFAVIAIAGNNSQALSSTDATTFSASPATAGLGGTSVKHKTLGRKNKAVDSQSLLAAPDLVVTAKKSATIKVDTTAQAAAVIVIPESLLNQNAPDAKSARGLSGGFFGPVTRLQEEVSRLEVEMSQLEAPMDRLSPGVSGIEKQLSGVLQQTINLQTQIGGLQGKLGGTTDQLVGTQSNIHALRIQLGTLITPVERLRDPVAQLRSPILDIHRPLISIETGLARVDNRFAALDQRFAQLDRRFVELGGRFTALDTRFVELDGRFTTLDTRFVNLGNQLQGLQAILSVILAAGIAGAVIAGLWFLVSAVLNWLRSSRVLLVPVDETEKQKHSLLQGIRAAGKHS